MGRSGKGGDELKPRKGIMAWGKEEEEEEEEDAPPTDQPKDDHPPPPPLLIPVQGRQQLY